MLRSAYHARRRDSVVGHIAYLAVVLCAVVAGASLVVTHMHKFHVALSARRQAVQDNRWLLEQCRSAEFYSNMRQHSALCDEVTLAEADTLWLHALRDVFDASTPCGSTPCEQRIASLLAWVFERGVSLLCGLALCAFLLAMAGVNVHRLLVQRQLAGDPYPQYEFLEDSPRELRQISLSRGYDAKPLTRRPPRIHEL